MAGTIFIHKADAGRYQWVIQESTGQLSALTSGDLEELTVASLGHGAILVLAGTETLLTQVSLPTRNRHKIIQALPYALEDQIIEDVDSLHFAIPGSIKNLEAIPVCVITRDVLAGPLSLLNDAGISVDASVSSIHCLPYIPDQWTVLIDDELVTVRTGIYSGFTLDTANLPEIFQILVGQITEETRPEHIRILDCRSQEEMATAFFPDSPDELSIEIQACNLHPLRLFAENYDPAHTINLLQGQFSRRSRRFRLSRKWIPLAALVLLSAGLQVTSWISEYVHLSNKLDIQKKQIESIFQQAMPGTKRIVNPQAQMQQRLDELTQGATAAGGDFLSLMTQASNIFANQKDLVLNAIQYRNNELDIEVVVKDLQMLDTLKQNLVQTGMNVEIRSASASGDQVNGRIKLKGKL